MLRIGDLDRKRNRWEGSIAAKVTFLAKNVGVSIDISFFCIESR